MQRLAAAQARPSQIAVIYRELLVNKTLLTPLQWQHVRDIHWEVTQDSGKYGGPVNRSMSSSARNAMRPRGSTSPRVHDPTHLSVGVTVIGGHVPSSDSVKVPLDRSVVKERMRTMLEQTQPRKNVH